MKHSLFFSFLKITTFISVSVMITPLCIAAESFQNEEAVQTQYQPIAMVNDSPITPVDVDKRINFLRIINNIPNTVQVTEVDKNKILTDLIEEKIKSQETTRFKIIIEDSRINEIFKKTATNLGISEQQLAKKLLKSQIDRLYFDTVTGNKLAWEELVQGRYGRDITVSTYEVSQIIEASALTENLSVVYNQIIIPFDNTATAKETIQKTLDDIAKRLETGEEFINIAKTFNPDNATQTKLLAQISPELADNLMQLQPEQISRPIRVENQIIIAQFIDKQKGDVSTVNQKITVKAGRLEYKEASSTSQKQEALAALNNNNDLCKNYDDYIDDVTVFYNKTMAELPESLRAVVKNTAKGETRIVREAQNSDYVLTVCDIKKPDYYNDVPEEIRNKTRNQIFSHKLSLKDQEYYRDLKKYAVITLFQ